MPKADFGPEEYDRAVEALKPAGLDHVLTKLSAAYWEQKQLRKDAWNRIRLLPDSERAGPLTELAWIDGEAFVNAKKHEFVVHDRLAIERDKARAELASVDKALLSSLAREQKFREALERIREACKPHVSEPASTVDDIAFYALKEAKAQ